MKGRDLDREYSEARLPLIDFLHFYNKTIPAGFPRASTVLLKEFRVLNKSLFKHGDFWSLGEHRKKVMDWLVQRAAYSDSK